MGETTKTSRDASRRGHHRHRAVCGVITSLAIGLFCASPARGQGSATELAPGFGLWSTAGTMAPDRPLESWLHGQSVAPCAGVVGNGPDVAVTVAEGIEGLLIRTVTTGGALLLVEGPGNLVACAQRADSSPGITLQNPRPGEYRITLGLPEPDRDVPYSLVVEETLVVPGTLPDTSDVTSTGAAAGLPDETILDVMIVHSSSFQNCRDAALGIDPAYTGEILVQFVVGVDGHVGDARVVQANPPNPPLEACVLEQLTRVEFPTPERSVDVTFPFFFAPLE